MKKLKLFLLSLAFLVVPTIVFAQGGTTGGSSSGNITTAGNDCSVSTRCVVMVVQNTFGAYSVTVTGTFSGTLQFEGTGNGDGSNSSYYTALGMTPLAGGSAVTSTTGVGTWTASASGLTGVRVRASAIASGTAVIAMNPSFVAFLGGGSGGGSGSGTVTSVATAGPITGGTFTTSGTIGCATCIVGSATLGFLPKMVTNTTTIGASLCDEGITTSNVFTCSDSAGASFVSVTSTSDGVHPSSMQFNGNTTLPSLTALTVTILGPPSASPTAWSLQLPAAIPATTDFFSCVVSSTNCLLTDTGIPATAAGILAACTGCTNTTLSNLGTTSINAALLAQTGVDLGSTAHPFRNVYLFGGGTYGTDSFELTGTSTANRTWTLQDSSDTFVGRATTDTLTNKSLALTEINSGLTSGGIACATSTTAFAMTAALTANVFPKGGGAGVCPTNSLFTDTGTTATYTGTGGLAAPVFTSTGTTAGFVDYPQGTTSSAVAPCNVATSICEQAPTAVTSYVVTKPGAAPTVNGSFAATSTAGVQSWQTANVQFCGTTTSCGATAEPLGKIVYGSTALVSGSPSTAAVTGISPAFTATGDYVCTVTAQSAAATALLSVANVSASAFTITGPATVTTVVNYICVGF